MVEHLCGARVLGDMDRWKSFEVRGGRRIDRETFFEARRFRSSTFWKNDVSSAQSFSKNFVSAEYYLEDIGRMTGINQDGKQARRDRSTMGKAEIGRKTLISVLWKFSMKPKDREISLIRMGAEKYLGLIAGQKFTGRTKVRPMDREARGGLLHGFRTWCQPSNNLSVSRSSRCLHAWKQYMQPDM
ncbi:hypothetical protein YC2023_077772 [Brassica napus]